MQRALNLSLQYVAVAVHSGTLEFLDTQTSQIRGSVTCCGELKAAPAVDPWDGCVWIASHGCEMIVCKAPGTPLKLMNAPTL